METFFESLSNPYLFTALILLTCISMFFTWIGIKEKNIPNFLIGFGAGIPPIALTNWRSWAAGTMIAAVGIYLRSKLSSPV